jgi:tryptophan halogenase
MHVCIVGSGTSGWLVANQLKELDVISKVTVIGSPKIPHIGVGESTTLSLPNSHSTFNADLKDFITKSHAAVKYGVYYQNWSKRDWIHFFKSKLPFERTNPKLNARLYLNLLGNKSKDTFIHDVYGKHIWREVVGKNNVFPNNRGIDEGNEEYPHSYHFDAGKYIEYLKGIALKSFKIHFIPQTVENVEFKGEEILSLNLDNNLKITADYYINTTGQRLNSKNIFNETYEPIGDVLLTNKAVVYPLEYKNKHKEFHPYTIAKTMKHGWRWITPTWERIGTGYTFSDNHISVDEAVDEFITDIGDRTIEPIVVDFTPRISKKAFKINHCSIGMANGFLEPLDAPGLALTNLLTTHISKLLTHYGKDFKSNPLWLENLDHFNTQVRGSYDFWVTFILNQYKSCYREDTDFWKDQKNVKWDKLDLAISNLNAYCDIHKNDFDVLMLAQTLASRDIQFNNPVPNHLTPLDYPLPESLPVTKHHLEWIESFHTL